MLEIYFLEMQALSEERNEFLTIHNCSVAFECSFQFIKARMHMVHKK